MTTIRLNSENRTTTRDWEAVQSLQKNKVKQRVILVVDDDEIITKLIKINLTLDGYQVHSVCDGSLALQSLEKFKPDLILLDIMMPGLDGFQVYNIIRKRSNIPVIIVTANWEILANHEDANFDNSNYLRKPFNISELTEIVKTKLQSAA